MKILDRLLLFLAAVCVGFGCGLAVTHVDDVVAADAIGYDDGVVENLDNSVWYFSAPPSLTGFPDNGDGNGYYSIGCFYDYYTPNGGLIVDSCNGIGYDSANDTWQFLYTSGATGAFLYNAYIRFTSSAVFSREGHSSDYTNNVSQFIWWLFNNAELLQFPSEPVSVNSVPSALDVGHLALFDLGDFIGNSTYGLRNIVHVDFLDTSGELTFTWRSSATWMPYQITFDKMEYGDGLCVTAVDFILVEGYPYENGFVFNCPFAFQMQGGNNLICWNYELGFNNISASSRSATDSGLFYRSVIFNSSSVSQFTTNKLNIGKFFGLYREGPQFGFQYRWLDRQAFMLNAYLRAGYHWIIADSDAYQIGYNDGYANGRADGYGDGDTAGYDRGYEEGRRVGYNQGQASVTDETTAVMNLFGAVISVPIGVLNGLSPLAIWNTPIIAIIVTFLFMGVLFMILKKVL